MPDESRSKSRREHNGRAAPAKVVGVIGFTRRAGARFRERNMAPTNEVALELTAQGSAESLVSGIAVDDVHVGAQVDLD